MSIKIYKDSLANAIFIEDANGVQFLNSLHATTENGTCSIRDKARNIDIVTEVDFSEFIDENDAAYGADATSVCNALNAMFTSSGSATGNPPSITSSLAISLDQGQSLNYELTADYGVGYEWDLSSVSGVTTVEGNIRKIVGGSLLQSGTYNIPVKVINYNGEDSETIVLTVDSPPFSSTKSTQFSNLDYVDGQASSLQNVLGRSGNGSGINDAWTISMFFKPSNSNDGNQTLFYYGGSNVGSDNHIRIKYAGQSNRRIWFEYGTTSSYLRQIAPWSGELTDNTWYHLIITYDGGTTGSNSGDVANYHSRFKIYIDGVEQTGALDLTGNNGNSSSLTGQNFRIGRHDNFGYLQSATKVDEVAIWDSDQSANVSSIYNSGQPHDLSLLASAPSHWWRMGDEDTFPTISDNIGSVDLTMNNMTISDIVTDVPS